MQLRFPRYNRALWQAQRLALFVGWRLCLSTWLIATFLLLSPSPFAHGYVLLPAQQSADQQPIPPMSDAALSTLRYGATAVVGEALEPCETEQTRPMARVLTPASSWESSLRNATPGAVFLLRGGLYQASSVLRIGAGLSGQLVTVKPYNCEAVTLRGGLQLQSYNFIAGLRIEGGLPTEIGASYALRIDGKTAVRRAITIRNNTIGGGEVDAVRINDQAINVRLSGNQIDGGKGGHDLFVTTETQPIVTSQTPTNIVVSNNRLTKVYYRASALPPEDMFQVRDARVVQFLANTCENGSRMEQCVDIKSVSAALTIRGNLFNGTTLHQDGLGEDLSSGCMVIHEFDGHPEFHVIEANYFKNCRTTLIRFASEGGTANSSGLVRYNVFLSPDISDADALLIWRSENVRFEYNTMIRGALKLGRGNGLEQNPPITPKNTTLKNNLFYQSRLDDNTQPPDFTYQCSYNLLYQLTQQGNRTLQCTNSPTADPRLTLLAREDYRPAANSLACTGGENGATIGARSCQPATAQETTTMMITETLAWYDAVTNPGAVIPAVINGNEVYDAASNETTAMVEELANSPDSTAPTAETADDINAELILMEMIYTAYLPLAIK